jgi:hypothetical protein
MNQQTQHARCRMINESAETSLLAVTGAKRDQDTTETD